MERSLNKVELRGNVGLDPRISSLEEGSVVMRLSLATNESYKNRKGELVEETVWHNIVAWAGKNMPDFDKIKKGMFLSIVGRLKPVQYVTKTGVERQTYEILAFNIKLEDNSEE
ncbi:MAG: single-stranded DNA-binding protein [Bacteroidia bacterium]|jgi:single-strand DNA-binding protein|nr:single-stranded DNA-binding protein [Bacteroidales bacterium]MDD3843938.1 single-stranded DNA-binding protein [Bacteroidales bacterium]MDD4618690.1 single-stranded DNA-binding protein [Bacteroidales bacterium]NCC46250.1 single-stranded DNA-binding protein [Bacteroidia bacterium]